MKKKIVTALELSISLLCGIFFAFLCVNSLNAEKNALASERGVYAIKQAEVRLTESTGENTDDYEVTTFSIIGIPVTESTSGFMCYSPICYTENVKSVQLMESTPGSRPDLTIGTTTDEDGKEHYYCTSGNLESWPYGVRSIIARFVVVHTGEFVEHTSPTGFTPTYRNIKSTYTETLDPDDIVDEIIGALDGVVAEKNDGSLDEFWAAIRPFVVYVLSAILSGTIVAGIISAAIKRKYDTKSISRAVVEEIAEKDISVDIETMTKKELSAIGTTLQSNLKEGMSDVTRMKRSVALLCNALSKSKTLTQEERDELAAEAKNLDAEVAAERREKVVVRLEKVEAPETRAQNGGLFDNLNK